MFMKWLLRIKWWKFSISCITKKILIIISIQKLIWFMFSKIEYVLLLVTVTLFDIFVSILSKKNFQTFHRFFRRTWNQQRQIQVPRRRDGLHFRRIGRILIFYTSKITIWRLYFSSTHLLSPIWRSRWPFCIIYVVCMFCFLNLQTIFRFIWMTCIDRYFLELFVLFILIKL